MRLQPAKRELREKKKARRQLVNSNYSCNSEFVFAPEERDVYSYERGRQDLAPSGSETRQRNLCRGRQDRLRSLYLRSFGVKEGPPGYRHLAPPGRSDEL